MSKHVQFFVALKVVLRNAKGEILILKVPDSSQMPGYYEFPGGRIEKSEVSLPFKEILKRETEEELGRNVKYKLECSPVAVGRHFSFLDYPRNKNRQDFLWVFFEAKYLGGEIKISDEHKDYKWVRLNKNNLEKYFIRGPLEGMQNYFSKIPRGNKSKNSCCR